ncbi:MAG: hypothetical protein HC779_04410 [Phyllobacteriaceae bacterium]|nr:hypothetical protein [Phyllobacteriaceae bacterium]
MLRRSTNKQPAISQINAALRALGLDFLAHAWLGNPKTALPALILDIVALATALPLHGIHSAGV